MAKRQNGEGTYGKKTINGKQYFYHRTPEGKFIYGKTQKELKEKIKIKEKEDSLKKTVQNEKNFTFKDLCDYWLKYEIRNKITERTYDDYEHIIDKRLISNELKNIQVQSIDVDMLKDYIDLLSKQYSKASIEKTWAIFRQVIKYGIKKKYIPPIDLEEISMPKEHQVAVKKKDVQFISLEDMELLYEETHRRYNNGAFYYGNNAQVIVFIMYSGLRISEAIGLTWKYVAKDFSEIRVANASTVVYKRDSDGNAIIEDGKHVRVKKQKAPKSESGERIIPLPERAKDVLKYFYETYKHNDNDFVFVSNRNTQIDKDNVERSLRTILGNSQCLCKEYTPHSLRHGYGSILIKKGVDINIVSKLLGHKDVSTTLKIYIHVYKDDVTDSVRRVFDE